MITIGTIANFFDREGGTALIHYRDLISQLTLSQQQLSGKIQCQLVATLPDQVVQLKTHSFAFALYEMGLKFQCR